MKMIKKSAVIFLVTILFVTSNLFLIKRAYDDWSRYSRLSRISNKVLTIFQDLHLQISKAAILNPDLLEKARRQRKTALFYSDSAAICQTLTRLRNTVADTVNEKIAAKLNEMIIPEIGWILSSSVPDSILQGNSGPHIVNFVKINNLITAGENRTQFLIRYRTGKLNDSFETLITLGILCILVYLAFLAVTFWSFFSERKKREKRDEQLVKKNRLYAFLSAINQTIVHSQSPDEVSERVAQIAMNAGEFSLAYLGLLDSNNNLQIKSLAGNDKVTARVKQMSGLNIDAPGVQNIPTVKVLKTGEVHINNNMLDDPSLQSWKKEFEEHGIRSSISLPIRMFGLVSGVLTFHARVKDFFDSEEISLLQEVAGDISFALENFEKVRKQKAMEEYAARNDKRYRAMIEKSNDLKTLTGKDGKFIYCSPSVLRVLGYSESDFIGRTVSDFFHPDDLPEVMKGRSEILDVPGASYFFQSRILHKNGNWIWCEGTATNFLNEPAIEAIVSNFRDVSVRRELEMQREFDRSNLKALINNTKDLMWSVDRFFSLITSNEPFNEAVRSRFKRPVEKGGKLLDEELGLETIELFKAYYERALHGETFSVLRQTSAQLDSWSEISFHPIKNGQEIVGTACFSRDITESRKHAAEREALIKQLTQHNLDLRQFAYITSHNLRAPVANLLGLTNLLDSYDLHDPVLNKILNGIKVASQSFDETISDLSNALTARENHSVKLEVVNLREVWEKVKTQLIPPSIQHQIAISCDFGAASHVKFNKAYMESIFVNLLSNSIKYKKDDSVLRINIKTALDHGKTILEFSDNGIGFDSDAQKNKVFGLYQRFHAHKDGKGLGLFLIKTQIESLGSSIKVTSKVNEGTKFLITFKCIQEDNDLQIE